MLCNESKRLEFVRIRCDPTVVLGEEKQDEKEGNHLEEGHEKGPVHVVHEQVLKQQKKRLNEYKQGQKELPGAMDPFVHHNNHLYHRQNHHDRGQECIHGWSSTICSRSKKEKKKAQQIK